MQTEHPTYCLWQRFIGEYPLALLSLYGNFSSLVWSVPNSRFEELMAMSDEMFLKTLNHALAVPSSDSHSVLQKYLGGSQRVEAPFVDTVHEDPAALQQATELPADHIERDQIRRRWSRPHR